MTLYGCANCLRPVPGRRPTVPRERFCSQTCIDEWEERDLESHTASNEKVKPTAVDQLFDLKCYLCGRSKLVQFSPNRIKAGNFQNCRECGGATYLEADESHASRQMAIA